MVQVPDEQPRRKPWKGLWRRRFAILVIMSPQAGHDAEVGHRNGSCWIERSGRDLSGLVGRYGD